MMIMIVIVIVLLRTNLSSLYRHQRGLGFTRSRLQGRKYNIRIAKLVFHAKESPTRTRDGVLSLVSSRSNSPGVGVKTGGSRVGGPDLCVKADGNRKQGTQCLPRFGPSRWR